MAGSKRKKTTGVRRKKTTASPLPDPLRTGMPALHSVTRVDVFGKGKKAFQIIHTNEVDEYENVPPKVRHKKR